MDELLFRPDTGAGHPDLIDAGAFHVSVQIRIDLGPCLESVVVTTNFRLHRHSRLSSGEDPAEPFVVDPPALAAQFLGDPRGRPNLGTSSAILWTASRTSSSSGSGLLVLAIEPVEVGAADAANSVMRWKVSPCAAVTSSSICWQTADFRLKPDQKRGLSIRAPDSGLPLRHQRRLIPVRRAAGR